MKILKPGARTVVQDAGRRGSYSLGLTTGGAADAYAYAMANRLCGNQVDAGALEITLGGFQCVAQQSCCVAITGAAMPLHINGEAMPLWRSYRLQAGDELALGYAQHGCRSYIAACAGFDVPLAFGSRATVVRESIGGIGGRLLVTGDEIPLLKSLESTQMTLLKTPVSAIPEYPKSITLRMVLGYQHAQFSLAAKDQFFQSEFTVSPQSDSMGYRFGGIALNTGVEAIYQRNMYSEGISLGAVQIPPVGLPIVMLNDRQTIGGYPKLGAVVATDTSRLAQCKPGSTIRFQPITLEQATALRELEKRRFEQTRLLRVDTDLG